jgi:Family of unknown function (DUF6335)
MEKQKKTSHSEDADNIVRRYIENQDPAQEDIQHEFTEAQTASRQQSPNFFEQPPILEEQGRLSGGDLDASSDVGYSGEETVGGSHSTPDQDNVDELGETTGLTFEDVEELRGEKVSDRDINRWELNPASSEDYEERNRS